jgi:hypothetical protein
MVRTTLFSTLVILSIAISAHAIGLRSEMIEDTLAVEHLEPMSATSEVGDSTNHFPRGWFDYLFGDSLGLTQLVIDLDEHPTYTAITITADSSQTASIMQILRSGITLADIDSSGGITLRPFDDLRAITIYGDSISSADILKIYLASGDSIWIEYDGDVHLGDQSFDAHLDTLFGDAVAIDGGGSFGTDLNVDGTANLDSTDIDGNLNLSGSIIRGTAIYGLHKTKKITIGTPGDVDTDFAYSSVANQNEQQLDLGTIIPAFARVMDAVCICTESVTDTAGAQTMSIDMGTSGGGAELIQTAEMTDTADEAVETDTGTLPILDLSSSAQNVHLNATPGNNWDTITAGQWVVFISYIDYGEVK